MSDGRRPIPEATWATRTMVRQGRVVARTVRGFRLVVESPDGGRAAHDVNEASVRVGSRPGADLVIPDRAISRLHFEITADLHGFRLRDLGSTNGTVVDGYRTADIHLRPGSVIEAGDTRFSFELTDRETEVPASAADAFGGAVGSSLPMRELFALLGRAAGADATVLLEGESGTGKEVLARSLHDESPRRQGPLVVVDCGAMPKDLLESLLFGHEKGAFTGATSRRTGQLEEADGGTLFLDEIGELPLELQPKLLRAIEAREVRRVGGSETIKVDVRFVAATNRDLAEEVNRGAFREDLYYRLAVIRVRVPPLRERREDVPLLVRHFVRQAFRGDPASADRVLQSITEDNWKRLRSHPWPGNVRELRNVIERSLALGGDDAGVEIVPDDALRRPTSALEVDFDRPYTDQKAELIERFDRDYLVGQLERHEGNISRAARASGMERMHFKRALKKHTS